VQATSSKKSAVVARTSTSAPGKRIEVDVEKPLGLTLSQKSNGVITINQVSGNAAKAGLKVGDQVIYTSSFFGDELWPADKLSFTQTAIKAKADSVYFVVQRGGAEVNTKRLPTRKAPSRFGKKLTASQMERATHICLDCGYIYTLQKSFDDQPDDFLCPQCRAPKTRFAGYDPETGRVMGGGTPLPVIISILLAIGAIGGLFYYLSL
jgi:rubredoxin